MRRKIVLSTSALPLFGLAGCGGGENASQVSALSGEHLTASATSAGTDSSLTVAFANPLMPDPAFYNTTGSGGYYIVPNATYQLPASTVKSCVQACVIDNQLAICLEENTSTSAGTYARGVNLLLSGFNLAATTAQSFASGTGVSRADVLINRIDAIEHFDYTLSTGGSISIASNGIIKTTDPTTNITTGFVTLTFNALAFKVTPNSMMSGNAASTPFVLNGTVKVPFTLENTNQA